MYCSRENRNYTVAPRKLKDTNFVLDGGNTGQLGKVPQFIIANKGDKHLCCIDNAWREG
jgi:hypothetical protein